MPLSETLSPDASSTTTQPAQKPGMREWLTYVPPFLLLLLVYSLLYRDGIAWLIEIWSHNDYSHGWLVPLISLYIVWEQRERYRPLPVAPAYLPAAAVIFGSLLLLLFSRASAVIQLEAASLFLIIPGIMLLLFGRRITRAALLPWLYLSFALPWFDLFLRLVQTPFQRVTAFFATKALSLIYPVYHNDIYIQLPSISMEVAKECSGVNFFIAVLAIGIPLVYLTQRKWTRALLVLVSGLLITILANGLRVTMAGIMGENFGPKLLHGPAHILQGMFVAWIGWIGLFVVNWLVAKKSDSSTPRLFERWKLRPSPVEHDGSAALPISSGRMYIAGVLLALCAVVTYFASPQPIPLSLPLASLPATLPDWKSAGTNWLDQEQLFPGADAYLERSYYSSRNSKPVELYIAYFNKQTEQKRLIRQLSQPLDNGLVTITLPGWKPGISPRKVNRTILVQDGIQYDAFFWYQFPDHTTVTGQNQARLAALENGILHRRNNGAVVLVAVQRDPAAGKEEPAAVPESIAAFIKEAGPGINALLP